MFEFLTPILPYLPQHEGFLPKWLLFVSIVSLGNSFQAYTTLEYTSRIYCGPPSSPNDPPRTASAYPLSKLAPNSPATPLSARTFGTWTILQSIVRLYAAYHIDNPQIYQMAFLTYVVAFLHFTSEWLWFRSARWGLPLSFPVNVATGSLIWMFLQWGYYVQ